MTDNRDHVALALEVSGILGRHHIRCALVGGLAVAARTVARATKDVDLAVAVSGDAAAEGVVRKLSDHRYVALTLLEHEERGCITAVRFRSPGAGTRDPDVDLLFASCGLEPEIVEAANTIEVVPGTRPLLVARLPHLIAMKVLSESDRRPQDRIDLLRLLAKASRREVGRARRALELIAARGFARGKALQATLARYLEEGQHRS